MLQEGEGEHRHERMAVETLPGSPFEVIEAEFLFQLLMGLLANPSCLDGGRPRYADWSPQADWRDSISFRLSCGVRR